MVGLELPSTTVLTGGEGELPVAFPEAPVTEVVESPTVLMVDVGGVGEDETTLVLAAPTPPFPFPFCAAEEGAIDSLVVELVDVEVAVETSEVIGVVCGGVEVSSAVDA